MAETPYFSIKTVSGPEIPIPEQTFIWEFSRGVTPYYTSVDVPLEFLKWLFPKGTMINPCRITISYDKLTLGQLETVTRIINDVYVLDYVAYDKAHIKIRLADSRYTLLGKKVTCAFNVTYTDNVLQSVIPTTFTPSDLRKPFETAAKGRYAKWSVKPPDYMPYKLSEVLTYILTQANITNVAINFEDKYDYVIENVVYNDSDLSSVLNDLLLRGGLSMAVSPDGQIYIYSLYSYTVFGEDQLNILSNKPLLGGSLYPANKQAVRPPYVNIDFEKVYEVVLADIDWAQLSPIDPDIPLDISPPTSNLLLSQLYQIARQSPEGSHDSGKRRFIWCTNVLPCPYPMTILGRKYNSGEWVSFKDFFGALGIPNHITYICTAGYFNGVLECRLLTKLLELAGIQTPTLAIRQKAATLYSLIITHFRRTYMLDPYYRQHIKEILPNRVGIVNNYDKKHSPAIVYKDFCLVGSVRIPQIKSFEEPIEALKESLNYDMSQLTISNNLWGQNFPIFSNVNMASPTPMGISIIDPDVLVFKVNVIDPVETEAVLILPYMVSPHPPFTAGYDTPDLQLCYPSYQHTFAAIISVIFNTAITAGGVAVYNHERFKRVSIDYCGQLAQTVQTPDAQFSEYTIRVTNEIARYPLPNFNRLAENEGLIQSIAYYYAGRIYNTFVDRHCGLITYAEIDDKVRIAGNINFVTWTFSPTGFTTTVSLYESLPAPSIETTLNQKQIDYIHSSIDRQNTFQPEKRVY